MRGTTNLPYIRHSPHEAPDTTKYVGGQVIRAAAGAALLVGDVVYWSAASTVNKSSTTADYATLAGVVVGGTDTFFQCASVSGDVGVTAASGTGKDVLVQISGIAFVKAAAAVAAASKVGVVTTAGQVDDSTATAGAYVGTAITAASSGGDIILMHIDHR